MLSESLTDASERLNDPNLEGWSKMATQLAEQIDGAAGAYRTSLESWGRSHKKYSPIYKILPKEILEIGFKALDEMKVLKPASWEMWWAMEHNRFIRNKKVRQTELLLLHEIMYHFLTDFVYGRLESVNAGAKRKAKA